MTREVPEWIAKSDEDKVPERVQLRVWRRQTDAEGVVHCAISGDPIYPGDDVQLDHRIPLILLGGHKESNLQFVLTRYHRLKTSEEVAVRAGNDARAKSHAGIKTTELTGLPRGPHAATETCRQSTQVTTGREVGDARAAASLR